MNKTRYQYSIGYSSINPYDDYLEVRIYSDRGLIVRSILVIPWFFEPEKHLFKRAHKLAQRSIMVLSEYATPPIDFS